jgi:hypothetical protein
MCKSIADGGKRCATHARPLYRKALKDYYDPAKSRLETMKAVTAFATTPKGKKEILETINNPTTDPALRQWLAEGWREGVAIADSEANRKKATRQEAKDVQQRTSILQRINISVGLISESEYYVLANYANSEEGYREIEALRIEAERNGKDKQREFFNKILSRADMIATKKRNEESHV